MGVTGASGICSQFSSISESGRKFSGFELKNKGCYCRPQSQTLELEDSVLLTLLTSGSEAEQQYALQIMAGPLVASEKARMRARRLGFIQPTTQALKNDELKTIAVKALAQMVKGQSESAEDACKANAVTQLAKLLRSGVLDQKTSKNSILLLQLLVEASRDGKMHVMDDGGADVLFTMLDEDDQVAQAAQNALKAIAAAPSVGEANTFVVTRLAQMLHNGDVSDQGKQNAILLLDDLALENADALSMSGAESTVIAALVAVLQGQVKGLYAKAAVTAMKALANLAGGELAAPKEHQDRRKAIILKTPGVLLHLLDILSSDKSEFHSKHAAKKLLRLLMSFGSDDVIDALINVLKEDDIRGHHLIREVIAMGFENIKRGLKSRFTALLREGVSEPSPDAIARLLEEI